MLVLLLAACASPEWPAFSWSYPHDDELRLDQVQMLGTHNSYHVANEGMGDVNQYTHAPLDVQLGEQGVRHFELDVDRDADTGRFHVRHIELIDEVSTCSWLTDCLSAIRGWSDANPAAQPIVVLIEPKDANEDRDDAAMRAWLDALEADVREAWPDRTITPDDVQGDAPDLRTALADGWPTLGVLRGKMLVVLHTGGHARDVYTSGGTSTAGNLLFAAAYPGEEDLPYAAVDIVDDPTAADDIAAGLARHELVRIRADDEEAMTPEERRPNADEALASGAQLLSTDHPTDDDMNDGFVFRIPGGTPSRCDPVDAPVDCVSEDVEDPAFVDVDGIGPGLP